MSVCALFPATPVTRFLRAPPLPWPSSTGAPLGRPMQSAHRDRQRQACLTLSVAARG